VSEYMAGKRALEEKRAALQREREEKLAALEAEMRKREEELAEEASKLETIRLAELDAEIADIKRRFIAFGIRPEQVFSRADLGPKRGRRAASAPSSPQSTGLNATNSRTEPKYEWVDTATGERKTWTGGGVTPRWFTNQQKAGRTAASMLIAGVTPPASHARLSKNDPPKASSAAPERETSTA